MFDHLLETRKGHGTDRPLATSIQINEVPNNGADCRRYDRQPSSVCVGLIGVTRTMPSIPFCSPLAKKTLHHMTSNHSCPAAQKRSQNCSSCHACDDMSVRYCSVRTDERHYDVFKLSIIRRKEKGVDPSQSPGVFRTSRGLTEYGPDFPSRSRGCHASP